MQIKPFFVIFPVLIGVIIYAYYAPKDKPERATTLTPKQYIELVEKNKREKREQSAKETQQAEKESSDKAAPEK
jgi:hypothetical protein